MSKEIIDKLASRAEPYKTSNHALAEALEQAGFYPKGTVYRDPSTLPKVDRVAMDAAAKEVGYNPNGTEEGKRIIDRLAGRLNGENFLSGKLLNGVQANPDKLRRAQELGLLSGGD